MQPRFPTSGSTPSTHGRRYHPASRQHGTGRIEPIEGAIPIPVLPLLKYAAMAGVPFVMTVWALFVMIGG